MAGEEERAVVRVKVKVGGTSGTNANVSSAASSPLSCLLNCLMFAAVCQTHSDSVGTENCVRDRCLRNDPLCLHRHCLLLLNAV